jgi:CubicO group peptidase (beta-lactamase class C family)
MRLAVILAATFGVVLTLSSTLASDNDNEKRVDRIFAAYNKPNSPGCAIGVIKDGKFIYSKAYGSANLELGVPLTTQSNFYVGSVSKQFTAATIVLAAEQGLLSLDDHVRKYIPELPSYAEPITLRQMLHQTSGFRDFETLTFLSGRNLGALTSTGDVLKLIARQKGLNNPPGEEFVYSNSNYFLLGVALKRATGKSLAEFARENIFQPLGMTHTLFYDDNTVAVPDRVAAYDVSENGKFLVDWSTLFDIVGPGGLMSNVDDLLQWDRNFYSKKLGKGTLVRELESDGVLADGHHFNYGMGLWLGDYRGLRTEEHSGAMFGYRAELLRFPDERFSVVGLCNVANADVEDLARKVSDVYLADQLGPEAKAAANNAALPDPRPFAGTYLDPRTHVIYTFTAANGSLMGWGSKLQRLAPNEFSDLVGNPIVFKPVNGTMTATLTLQGDPFFFGNRVPETRLSESALGSFTGDYYSEELGATYVVSLVHEVLDLKIGERSPVNLTPVGRSEFQAGVLGTLVFHAAGNQVSGLTFFSQAARGITFKKTS